MAQVEMQILWDKRLVMSPEGVAKQEVTVFDLTVWHMHWLKLHSKLYRCNP